MSRNKGWRGVDFDGTLCKYDGWQGCGHCGEPIPKMVERVKRWLAQGDEVRIFTARVYCPNIPALGAPQSDWDFWEKRKNEVAVSTQAIESWCLEHLGQVLPITCVKDFGMFELWDDRAVQVIPNTGLRVDRAEY